MGSVLLSGTIGASAGPASDTATFDFPSGLLQWQGIIGGSGTLTNASGGFLSENGTGLDRLNTTLMNAGTLTVSGSNPLNLFAATGTLTNAAGGVIEVQAGAAVSGGAASNVFTNLGTLTHSGTGTGTINAFLNNQGGTINVQSGTLTTFSINDTYQGGTFLVAPGAHLRFWPRNVRGHRHPYGFGRRHRPTQRRHSGRRHRRHRYRHLQLRPACFCGATAASAAPAR